MGDNMSNGAVIIPNLEKISSDYKAFMEINAPQNGAVCADSLRHQIHGSSATQRADLKNIGRTHGDKQPATLDSPARNAEMAAQNIASATRPLPTEAVFRMLLELSGFHMNAPPQVSSTAAGDPRLKLALERRALEILPVLDREYENDFTELIQHIRNLKDSALVRRLQACDPALPLCIAVEAVHTHGYLCTHSNTG